MDKINSQYKKITKTRDSKLYSSDLIHVLNHISLKDSTKPVGSFKYLCFKYPGDIDVFEMVESCCNKKMAAKRICRRFRHLMLRLKLSQPTIYFADFKAGKDQRFDKIWNILLSIEDKMNTRQLKKFQIKIDNIISELQKNKAVSLKWIKQFKSLDINNIEEMKDMVRSCRTIRWNIEELTKEIPHKMLKGGFRIDLSEAIQHDEVVKLDVWAYLDNRYIEVTNFFNLTYLDSTKDQVFPLNRDMDSYTPSIAGEVLALVNRPNKLLKCTKRLWLLLNSTIGNKLSRGKKRNEEMKLFEAITPMMSSAIAALSQIVADTETLKNMINQKMFDQGKLITQFIGISNRVSEHLSAKRDAKMIDLIDNMIDNVLKNICVKKNNITISDNSTFNKQLQKTLDKIEIILVEYINTQVERYLKKNGITKEDIIRCAKRYIV